MPFEIDGHRKRDLAGKSADFDSCANRPTDFNCKNGFFVFFLYDVGLRMNLGHSDINIFILCFYLCALINKCCVCLH